MRAIISTIDEEFQKSRESLEKGRGPDRAPRKRRGAGPNKTIRRTRGKHPGMTDWEAQLKGETYKKYMQGKAGRLDPKIGKRPGFSPRDDSEAETKRIAEFHANSSSRKE